MEGGAVISIQEGGGGGGAVISIHEHLHLLLCIVWGRW